MKFFAASYFFHTFVTETAGERPACNHAGCEAGLEESTLLQLAQFKNKANSQSKTEVDETSLLAKEHHSGLIDQRIISGLHYMESHRDAPMTNWRACLDKVGDPQMHIEKETFDDLTACFDDAEKADGIKDWLQNGQPLSLIALNASSGNPLERQGHNCWGSCGHRGGSCNWCGSEGACCRRGWGGDPSECGNNGGDGYHMCTLRVSSDGNQDRTQGLLRHAGADCYNSCGRSGHCHYCGARGACCRQGYGGSGCANNVGGRDHHMCVWESPSSSLVHRANLPSYCENELSSSHECSCAAMNWRISQYVMWERYQHNWGPQVGLVGQGRMAAVARCGFICPTHARWQNRNWVRAGTVWETEYGFTTTDGWEMTSSTEREISDSMSVSMGFEFEGIGFGSDASTTVTTRESLTTAMSGSTENEMRRGDTIPWNSPGNVWQARSVTRDTCGGTLSIMSKVFALTPSIDNRPRCLPGRCNEHNLHGYCCTCHGGSQFEIPNSPPCQPRSCAIEATVDWVISGRDGRLHTVTFEPGIEIQHSGRTSFPCSNAGQFTGDVTLECMYGGLAVVGPSTTCTVA